MVVYKKVATAFFVIFCDGVILMGFWCRFWVYFVMFDVILFLIDVIFIIFSYDFHKIFMICRGDFCGGIFGIFVKWWFSWDSEVDFEVDFVSFCNFYLNSWNFDEILMGFLWWTEVIFWCSFDYFCDFWWNCSNFDEILMRFWWNHEVIFFVAYFVA